MPTETRNRRAGVHQPTELLEPQEQIQVEGQLVAGVETADLKPGIGPDQHSWLRDQVGPPGEHPRGPTAGLADPQWASMAVDVLASPECHNSP